MVHDAPGRKTEHTADTDAQPMQTTRWPTRQRRLRQTRKTKNRRTRETAAASRPIVRIRRSTRYVRMTGSEMQGDKVTGHRTTHGGPLLGEADVKQPTSVQDDAEVADEAFAEPWVDGEAGDAVHGPSKPRSVVVAIAEWVAEISSRSRRSTICASTPTISAISSARSASTLSCSAIISISDFRLTS